jgi:hypothetical protein
MIRKSLFAFTVASLVGMSGMAGAQSIQFDQNGVRLVPPGQEEPRYDTRRPHDISRSEAIRIAMRNGVREVETVDRTRRAFEVIGYDRRSRDITVIVDRRTGDVIDVQR